MRQILENENKGQGRGLTGFGLKIVGILLMVCDHIHQMFVSAGAPIWLTYLGRPVAPIFLFLCAEGYHYTKSKKRYVLGLLIAAEIMSICSFLLQKVLPNENVVLINSMLGTLFFCSLYMALLDYLIGGFKAKHIGKILLGVLFIVAPLVWSFGITMLVGQESLSNALRVPLMFVPNVLMVEGGIVWVLLALLFHIFRTKRLIQILALTAVSAYFFVSGDTLQACMIFAAIPMFLYNGKRGGEFLGRKTSKYFFYIFYPAHIYALYIASTLTVD